MKRLTAAIFLIGCIIGSSTALQGQSRLGDDYRQADRLLEQQDYENAYDLFIELHEENPQAFLFLDKAVECLINLKRYDEAIERVRDAIERRPYSGNGEVLLAELYHYSGDTEKAYEQWENTLIENAQNMQVFLTVARSQADRNEFDRAIATYRQAGETFSDASFIASELADTYMLAGQFENAIAEYLKLIDDNPDRLGYVQQRLIRTENDELYDTAILEIDDFLEDMDAGHPAYNQLMQLEMWLLLERELYERALAAALRHEERTGRTTYILYNLADRLASERQYELAEEAYVFYTESEEPSVRFQSIENLADVYIDWAGHLSQYSLAYADRIASLYMQGYERLEQLTEEAPDSYERMPAILIKKAELAIDYMHDPGLAGDFLERIDDYRGGESMTAQREYIEGRIRLFDGEYSRARIALTRANKQAESEGLQEKTRYYLALTDFFEGDYEFADIQLNTLERESTSDYANDALQLRTWIQKGTRADSTGKQIGPFARAVEQFHRGEHEEAVGSLEPILTEQSYHPLADEALLLLGRHVTPAHAVTTYRALNSFLQSYGQASGLRERLMWERARIADQMVFEEHFEPLDWTGNDPDPQDEVMPDEELPLDRDELITHYEDLLMNFPEGFYSSYARDRIRELQEEQS